MNMTIAVLFGMVGTAAASFLIGFIVGFKFKHVSKPELSPMKSFGKLESAGSRNKSVPSFNAVHITADHEAKIEEEINSKSEIDYEEEYW